MNSYLDKPLVNSPVIYLHKFPDGSLLRRPAVISGVRPLSISRQARPDQKERYHAAFLDLPEDTEHKLPAMMRAHVACDPHALISGCWYYADNILPVPEPEPAPPAAVVVPPTRAEMLRDAREGKEDSAERRPTGENPPAEGIVDSAELRPTE